MLKKHWAVLIALIVTAIVVGVWWWRWQAPYRTLTTFIDVLYNGNIKALYDLMPYHERHIVTEDMVEITYFRFLKPLLSDHFPKSRLIHIEHFSERPRIVIFYLWFREQDKPLVIYLCYPPDRQGWKVPFSYFIWLNAKGLYGDLNADQIMYRLGYQRVATPEGDTFALRVK
jgi:hypothetical protein